jgi:hypothetical protein
MIPSLRPRGRSFRKLSRWEGESGLADVFSGRGEDGCFRAMELITILNHCHCFHRVVYQHASYGIEPMKRIARSLRQHRELILNYHRAQKLLSIAVVEGSTTKANLS